MSGTELGHALLGLARQALNQALRLPYSPPQTGAWPTEAESALRQPGATFVTMTQHGHLRGCIGTLEAWRPLQDDVQANAVAAGLRDPRFPPLQAAEGAVTRVEVSLLSATEPMDFLDEADALRQLRPGEDGVVLHCGPYRSTFLPQVWEQLPRPADFLAQLKQKAGLPPRFWSDELRLERYTVTQWREAE